MDGRGTRTGLHLKPYHVARLQRALRYMEQNVGRRTSLRELARVAAIAPHHFHRLFAGFAGETAPAQMRRLRLERAGFELFTSEARVAEVARHSGYTSPAAFARAFARHFGLVPRNFRRAWSADGYMVSIAPDLRRTFERSPFVFCDEPDKHLKFVRRRGPLLPTAHVNFDTVERLLTATPRARDAAIYEHTPDYPPITPPDRLRIDTAFDRDCTHRVSDELTEQTVPGGRYVVFTLDAGPHAKEVVVQLWNYIYLVWARRHHIRIRSGGAYEVYRRHAGRAFRVEVHVPVQTSGRTAAWQA